MSWEVRVHRGLDELGAGSWPPRSSAGLYGTALWLRNAEGVLDAEPHHLTAWRPGAGRPSAALPCWLVRDPAAYLFYNPPRLLLDEVDDLAGPGSRLRELAAGLRPHRDALYPALLATSPFGYVAPVCTNGAAEGAPDRLLDAFADLGHRLGAPLLVFPYLRLPEQAALSAALDRRGYHAARVGGLCDLDVRWPDLDGYLASLPPGRRRSARRELRAFAEAGGEVTLEGPEVLDERLAAIELAHQRRFTTVAEPSLAWILDHFAALRGTYGDVVRVFTARAGGRAVGFLVAYEHDRVLYCKQVAVDHSAASPCTYFNLGYYGPLRYATATGIRRVEYGMGAYEAKLLRGCRLTPLEARVRCALPAVAGRLPEYLAAYGAAQERRAERLAAYAGR